MPSPYQALQASRHACLCEGEQLGRRYSSLKYVLPFAEMRWTGKATKFRLPKMDITEVREQALVNVRKKGGDPDLVNYL